MKLLLLSAFCMISLCLSAQIQRNNAWVMKQDDIFQKFKGNGDTLRKQFQEYLQKRQFRNDALSKKHGSVITLPQDNMPCVVPDTNSMVAIPNAWTKTTVPYKPQYHPIPNPGLPSASFSYRASDNWKPTK
jgi:hypothetical protein